MAVSEEQATAPLRAGTLGAVLWLTLAFEAVTILFRFGLGLESTRDTASTIGVITFGLRIHHGYLGVVGVLVAPFLPRGPGRMLWILGWALVLSDLAHHFLVLWPIVGDPEFHIWYPQHP